MQSTIGTQATLSTLEIEQVAFSLFSHRITCIASSGRRLFHSCKIPEMGRYGSGEPPLGKIFWRVDREEFVGTTVLHRSHWLEFSNSRPF
jgi:hypothetical protein